MGSQNDLFFTGSCAFLVCAATCRFRSAPVSTSQQYTSAPAVEKRRGGEESEGEKQGWSEYTQSAWQKEEIVGKEEEEEEEEEVEEDEEREDERSQHRIVESHDPEKRRRRDETGEEDKGESAEEDGEEEEDRGLCHLFEPGGW
ncbi:unnamed protein product [Closterium sp. NIES-54]